MLIVVDGGGAQWQVTSSGYHAQHPKFNQAIKFYTSTQNALQQTTCD
jgi:hypothetical protein